MHTKNMNNLDKLPLKDRIIVTASSKLLKHFRGLESAGMLDKETTANLVGCVKKITAIAKGEEPKPEAHGTPT